MEIIKIIFSLATPLAIAFFGFLFNRQLIEIEQKREEERHKLERRHKTRIQFNVKANIIGAQKGIVITEIIVVLENQGFTQHKIDEIGLKVLGVKVNTEVKPFEKDYPTKFVDSIIDFPHDLINTNMLARMKKDPKGDNEKVKHFLEPGVVQPFTYVARIPEDIAFILVTASFKYNENSEHTAKRVFAVKARNSDQGESHS